MKRTGFKVEWMLVEGKKWVFNNINSPWSPLIMWANLVPFSLPKLQLCFLFFADRSIPMPILVYKIVIETKLESGEMLKILWNEYSQARDSGCKPLVWLDKWTLADHQLCPRQNAIWYYCHQFFFFFLLSYAFNSFWSDYCYLYNSEAF